MRHHPDRVASQGQDAQRKAETEPRAPIFQYPEYDFTVTDAVTNYSDSAD